MGEEGVGRGGPVADSAVQTSGSGASGEVLGGFDGEIGDPFVGVFKVEFYVVEGRVRVDVLLVGGTVVW